MSALKMVEVVTGNGIQVSSRRWKRQGEGFAPRASRRNAVLLTCDLTTHVGLLTSKIAAE